jgi:hypothetical protein
MDKIARDLNGGVQAAFDMALEYAEADFARLLVIPNHHMICMPPDESTLAKLKAAVHERALTVLADRMCPWHEHPKELRAIIDKHYPPSENEEGCVLAMAWDQ